jgi:hypothetical protein
MKKVISILALFSLVIVLSSAKGDDGVMTKEGYESYFGEPGTMKARYLRYFKTNFGVSGNKKKLFRLISRIGFNNLESADRQIDWSKAPLLAL